MKEMHIWIYVGSCCLLVMGCGSDGKPRRVPVSGTVRYLGNPIPGGDVVFVPVDRSSGFRACGKSDERGHFELTTFDDRDGALPGEYKVTVFAYRPADPQRDVGLIAPRVGLPAVPVKYFDQQTTDLTVAVGNQATDISIDLVN